ncbi:MAG TPA: hypothetical protein VK666_06915 [Chryseolinea sp.]|nr:hypothetical protein [Chryseolinea sp.]
MSTGGKIVITLGIASSALVAAWLLTGNRKEKTREFVSKKSETFKAALRSDKILEQDDQAFYYV